MNAVVIEHIIPLQGEVGVNRRRKIEGAIRLKLLRGDDQGRERDLGPDRKKREGNVAIIDHLITDLRSITIIITEIIEIETEEGMIEVGTEEETMAEGIEIE